MTETPFQSHVISRYRIPFLFITKERPTPILITTTCKICKQTWTDWGIVGQMEYQISAALSCVYQGIMGIFRMCHSAQLLACVLAALWSRHMVGGWGGGAVVTPCDLGQAPRCTQSWRSKRRENKVLLHHRPARYAVMWTLLIPLKLLNKQF